MSELKQQIDELNKKYYSIQERMRNSKETMNKIAHELKDIYGLDVKKIKTPEQLKKFIAIQKQKRSDKEVKLLNEAKNLNARINIT